MKALRRLETTLANAIAMALASHLPVLVVISAKSDVWYNYARINSAVKMAPAMEPGISVRLWDMSDIVKLIDKAAPKLGPRGPYRSRNSN